MQTEQHLLAFLSFAAAIAIGLLIAVVVVCISVRMCGKIKRVCISRQLVSTTGAALLAFAIALMPTIAKRSETTGDPPVGEQQTGTIGVPPVGDGLTDSLRFAAIDVHADGTATLAVAWPTNLVPANTTIDILAATSLVNSVWTWQCCHTVAEGETNWNVTVTLPETAPGTNAPSAFYRALHREMCADTMDDLDGDGFMNLHEYWAGTDPNDAADDGAGTALYAATHAVDDRIVDKTGDVTVAKQIYIGYNKYDFNTNLVRNADCWIADIDVTCSSIWNDDPGYHYGDCATLITPQHVVLAAHLNSTIWRGYIFRAPNGTTTVRRLVDKLRIGSTDITVGLLESPLPAEYAPAKLLPPDYERHLGTGRLVPVFHQNQFRNAFVVELPDLSTWMTRSDIYMNYGSTSLRYTFMSAVIGHDSGNPCFMLVDDQRILLYATYIRQNANGAPGGPHTALYAREIQSAIDTMSDRVAMPRRMLQFFDFSQFAELHEGGTQ